MLSLKAFLSHQQIINMGTFNVQEQFWMLQCNHTKNRLFSVEPALAERYSKNATFFFSCVCAKWSWSQALLAETVETGDKLLVSRRDESHAW